jgi:hypothetical protein
MKLFSHTFANWGCPGCNRSYSAVSPNLHGFFLGVTFAAALALQVKQFFMPDRLPWYYFFSLWAGELLFVIFAGLLVSPLMGYLQKIPKHCPACGGTLFFAGRYFKTVHKPHWTDALVSGVFIAANVLLWF